MRIFRILALVFFLAYLAVYPGSTLMVALDRVPAWGEWLSSALLMVQGAAVLCWLVGAYGRRGAVAALLVTALAWGVEHIGVTFGFPFGCYSYTAQLQPLLFGAVPLAIACAWLMVAIGAWQLATTDDRPFAATVPELDEGQGRRRTADDRRFSAMVGGRWSVVVAATLVLLLDLQIETVATKINAYWIWRDHGPYYGVPTANFVAWWLVGLAMALVVAKLVPVNEDQHSSRARDLPVYEREIHLRRRYALRTTHYILRRLPAALYVLSTLMFAIVNLAHGYALAGCIGVAVLVVVVLRLLPHVGGFTVAQARDARKAE